jgi:hypothetical protein
MVEGGSVWAVWQKSSAFGAELIHAGEKGAHTWPLDICKGRRGQDVWGHLALANVNGRKFVVYYAGNALLQKYLDPTPPYRPVDCFSPEFEPPLGPAELAVFDIGRGSVAFSYSLSAQHQSLRPNLPQHYLDESQMVVAGRWAYVGWIDLTSKEAALRLLAFDVTSEKPAPVETSFPLGFDSEKFSKSHLTDLIAVDGRLHALVTRSSRLVPNVRVFEAQAIVTLGLQ